MSKPKFSIISWVNNKELYQEMVQSFANVDCEFIELGAEYTSMASAYNAGTDLAQGQYLVYCHQDVRLMDEKFDERITQTFSEHPGLGFIGIVGTKDDEQHGLWFSENPNSFLGSIVEFSTEIKFGNANHLARTLDGLMLITERRFAFPEILPGIHFVDAWMCRQAEDAGYYNWVTDVKVQHLSRGNTTNQEYHDNLELYRWYWYHKATATASPRVHQSKYLPNLSIVIAVYNNLFCTRRLIEQLQTEAPGAEIIIVNNASTDGTRRWLNAQKHLKVIENSSNEGVSRAWNAGLRAATGKVMAVLNNDVELLDRGISRLYAAAMETGISCATMIRSNREVVGGHLAYRFEDSDYANGEALFFRRDIWLNVGEFDESYTLAYYEDSDWSCRARLKGYQWQHVRETLIHHQGQTANKIPEIKEYIANNRALFMGRYSHLGFGEHVAFDCHGNTNNIVDIANKIQQRRQEKPLSRIYVFCSHDIKALFASSTDVDYVGPNTDSLHYDEHIPVGQAALSSPLVGPYPTPAKPKTLVGTLMCDRKKSSQMVSLQGIEKMTGNFEVYINIQSKDAGQNFADVYTWAKKQPYEVHIDTWDWESTWSRKPEFDQDRARLAPICYARNMMLQAASSLNYDFLLQVDNDVIVPPNALKKLLAENRPIVGGVVPGRGVHSKFNYVFQPIESLEQEKQVVMYTTCGFVLLRRDVFEYLRYRTGWGIQNKQILSEDPAFFNDAADAWNFGRPVLLMDLKAEHWDDPEQPLKETGVDRPISVLNAKPKFN